MYPFTSLFYICKADFPLPNCVSCLVPFTAVNAEPKCLCCFESIKRPLISHHDDWRCHVFDSLELNNATKACVRTTFDSPSFRLSLSADGTLIIVDVGDSDEAR